MTYPYEFDYMSFADAAELDDYDDWLVEDIVGATTTLLYGEAKSGKSFLVSALIKSLSTGEDFLDKPVPVDREFSTAILWTDDLAPREYRNRVLTVMPEGQSPEAGFYRLPIMQGTDMWHALYEQVMANGHNLVVIDNMTQALDGSYNDDGVIRRFFDGVRLFVRAGIPVVVIAHSSDKAGLNGKPTTPLGNSLITASVRHKVFVKRNKRGNLTLTLKGANAEESEMTLRHGVGARFDIIGGMSAEALKARAEGTERKRSKERLDAGAECLAWLNTNCHGMTVRDAGEKWAAHQGNIKATTATSQFQRFGIRKDGEGWGRMQDGA